MTKFTLLKNVADVIMGQSPPSHTYNEDGKGLPFFQGKAEFSSRHPVVKKWCNTPVKIAQPDDILLSVRAPVGPTNLCNVESCIGRGLAAIRCKKRKSDPLFLWYYLRSTESRLASKGVGSTFTAIGKEQVNNIAIPEIDYTTQRKIAAILEKAESALEKRREANRLTDEFLKSSFLDMFGDPVRNTKEWKRSKLAEVGTIERGKSKHRPRNAPELLGGPYPLIQTGDIANSQIYIYEHHQTYSEIGLKQSRLWPRGTLCITIAANIAKTGILTFDACFPDSVVGFSPKKNVTTEYIHFYFSFYQKILEKLAPESAQKNINLQILRNLNVPIPPLPFQQTFSALVEKAQALKQKQRASETELQNLFGSLMQRAFRGELVS